MDFVIQWNERAMGLHVFPIPIPPPTSLSTRSLWVFPVHQAQALVSCIQPGLVICFTLDNIRFDVLLNFKKWTTIYSLHMHVHVCAQNYLHIRLQSKIHLGKCWNGLVIGHSSCGERKWKMCIFFNLYLTFAFSSKTNKYANK